MSDVAADTHAILWYLSADPRLSVRARALFENTSAEGDAILVPTICIVEATYLAEKKRIDSSLLAQLLWSLAQPESALQPVPLSFQISVALREVSRDSVPDMPDRVIAATALALGVPLVTRDRRIVSSDVEAIW